MMWTKLDVQFHSNPKVVAAWEIDPAAVGLYARVLSHASSHLTDGHVSEAYVRELMPMKSRRNRAVNALVTTGLWEQNGAGYTIHDYRRLQPLTRRSSRTKTPREIVANHDRLARAHARARGCARPQPHTRTRLRAPAAAFQRTDTDNYHHHQRLRRPPRALSRRRLGGGGGK